MVGICLLVISTFTSMAQDAQLERSVITITNNAKAVLKLKVSERKYLPLKSFDAIDETVAKPVFTPVPTRWFTDSLPKIDAPIAQDMRSGDANKTAYGDKYTNALELGVGTYGRTLFNFKLGQSSKENKFLGVYVQHDANQFGAIRNDFSGRSENQARIESRSLGRVNYYEGSFGVNQRVNYYYGLGDFASFVKPTDIQVIYNRFNAQGKVSSTRKNELSDYYAKFDANLFANTAGMSEMVMEGKVHYVRKSTDKLRFILDLDYTRANYQTQVGTAMLERGLYRINPSLAYKSSRLSLSAGLLLVTDQEGAQGTSKSSIYPHVQLEVNASDFIHVFGGLGGDVQFNSLRDFTAQNPWMRLPTSFKNTNQVANVFAGIKGVGNKFIDFEAKYVYSEYADLPIFVNAVTDQSKFDVLYIGGIEKIALSQFIAQVNVHVNKSFVSNFKIEKSIYQQVGKAFYASHRPGLILSWTNSWYLSDRIMISPDLYMIKELYSFDPIRSVTTPMEDIVDVNMKISYFIKRNMNIGLTGNNLIGKTYQRFNQYQLQGTSATLSFAYSF